MNCYNDLKQEYTELLEDVRKANPQHAIAEHDVQGYLLAAIMRIWGANVHYTPEYAKALEAVTGKIYTPAQIVTAMECASEEGRWLNLPVFVEQAIANDKGSQTNRSCELIDAIVRLLAAMAAVNDDLTLEEANVLEAIADHLHGHADRLGVARDISLYNVSAHVTPRNPEGYWTRRPETAEEEPQKKEGTSKEPTFSITLGDFSDDDKPKTSTTVTPSGRTPKAPSAEGSSGSLTPTRPTIEENGEITATPVEPDEPASVETLENLLAELNGLVGLDRVKRDVQSLLNFIKVCRMREKRGFKAPAISYHLVFTGNPGTGKTTVARLVAKIYYHMGLLPKGQLVEADRSTLVAGYLGQTAIKTQKVIQSALGGVLFIDEAYALANDERDSYGKEAIETLLKAMEDHRDELVVIVAGYDELMHKFIDSNPGLRSRFNKYFHFPDYTGGELSRIFERFCKTNGYEPTPDVSAILEERFDSMYENRREHFGNARDVRNLFEKAIHHQANRVAALSSISDHDLLSLTKQDVLLAFEEGV